MSYTDPEIGESPRTIVKLSTESVSNNAVLQDDNDFSIILDALSSYEFEFCFFTTCGSISAGFKFRWTLTGGAGGLFSWGGTTMEANGAAAVIGDDERGGTTQVVNHAVSGQTSIICKGLIVTGTANQDFQLEWAQDVATANATNLLLNSYAKFRKLIP